MHLASQHHHLSLCCPSLGQPSLLLP
uniref:Uncharacterized protein n=1 Tax=Arundo donax TaxID=35708 RepID=A0A0A8Y5Z1_ARUDO